MLTIASASAMIALREPGRARFSSVDAGASRIISLYPSGEVAEWLKAAVC
jgi:hypothetical protein